VITVMVSGELPEAELRLHAERVRDDLADAARTGHPGRAGRRASLRDLDRDQRADALREYGLTLEQVASAVRRASLDLAAGSVRTTGGEVLIRTQGQARAGDEFADIVVRSESTAHA
jgi:multidrug efflux pump subunit AcrB